MRFCSITTQSVTPRRRPTNSPIVRTLYPSSAMTRSQQGAGLEVIRVSPELDRAVGQQMVVTVHHLGGESIFAGVVVAPQIGEQTVDLASRVAAEQVRELRRVPGIRLLLVQQGAREADGGRHREELHHDVHTAEEEPLLPLHPRLIYQDAVEALASELATAALDEAHVRPQPAEVVIAERRGQ